MVASNPHHQPLRHWKMKGVEHQSLLVPTGTSSLFREYFQMRAVDGVKQIEFPVYPLGHLLISINFQKNRTKAYLFGLNQTTWNGVLTGGEYIFGGAFEVGTVFSSLGLPGVEMTDRIIDMEEIWPRRARELIALMEHSTSIMEKITTLETFFGAFQSEKRVIHPLVQSVLAHLDTTPITTIHEVARKENVSRRHLSRLFSQHVGMPPKSLIKLYRVKQLRETLRRSTTVDLSELSYAHGYYDQAHFNRDFKRYFGVNPTQYIRNGLDLN